MRAGWVDGVGGWVGDGLLSGWMMDFRVDGWVSGGLSAAVPLFCVERAHLFGGGGSACVFVEGAAAGCSLAAIEWRRGVRGLLLEAFGATF